MKLVGEMFILILCAFVYFSCLIESNSKVYVIQNNFLMKELDGKNFFRVAGKIESQVYIQFYENYTQVIEILAVANASGSVMESKQCWSTRMDASFTDTEFRWIWIKWTGSRLTVGLGKTDDDWGISRLDNFVSRPTTVVFLSGSGRSEWIFEDPRPTFLQNMYKMTKGMRGGMVNQKIKAVSVLACISRCTQINKCAAANFSPNEEEINCELILIKAKHKPCYVASPNKLTGYTSSKEEMNWNLYIKQ